MLDCQSVKAASEIYAKKTLKKTFPKHSEKCLSFKGKRFTNTYTVCKYLYTQRDT